MTDMPENQVTGASTTPRTPRSGHCWPRRENHSHPRGRGCSTRCHPLGSPTLPSQANPSLHRRLAPRLLAAAVILAAAGVGAIGVSGRWAPRADPIRARPPGHPCRVHPAATRHRPPPCAQDPANQLSPRAIGLQQQFPPVHLRRRRDPLRAATCSRGSPAELRVPAPPSGTDPTSAAPTCAGPNLENAQTYPIELDGSPAALVIAPLPTETGASPETQTVDAWSCDGSKLLAHAVVPLK